MTLVSQVSLYSCTLLCFTTFDATNLGDSCKFASTAETNETILTKTVEIAKNTKATAVNNHINRTENSCLMTVSTTLIK